MIFWKVVKFNLQNKIVMRIKEKQFGGAHE